MCGDPERDIGAAKGRMVSGSTLGARICKLSRIGPPHHFPGIAVIIDMAHPGQLLLIEAIKSGDKTHALEAMTQHIHAGYDLQIEGMTSG